MPLAKIDILVKGYYSTKVGGGSCSNIILIRDGKYNIVVDPGTTKSQKLIINKLKKLKLTPDSIDYVFITHSHMDHYRNIGMFARAKAIDSWGLWYADIWKGVKKNITKNIKLITTPGHSKDNVTFLVKTDEGKVAICGDVFWDKNYPKKDPYADNLKQLEQSRKKISKLADWIIPGHGPMFKT